MSNNESTRNCLTADDLSAYVAQAGGGNRRIQIEAHLAECPHCRQAVADLLQMLYPESEPAMGEVQEPDHAELEEMIGLVQRTAAREQARAGKGYRRQRRLLAAAAALLVFAVGLWSFQYIRERNKGAALYAQAKTILQENYSGKSPGNLRLALPFSQATSNRDLADHDSLRRAENLLYQAIGVRDGLVEARLGIAYIRLSESQFDLARKEFQEILDADKGNIQALLGRGVAQYEEASRVSDAVQRGALLAGALTDFNAVLGLNPDSAEARYDKSWALYESGRHKEALQEIESYLARDTESVWAEEMRRLRTRIQAADSTTLEKEVNHAAGSRDSATLSELAWRAPSSMPAAIRSAMRRSLELDGVPGVDKKPGSEDLVWAARILEAAYAEATGDHSFQALLGFYQGLSPGQRFRKRNLDQKFQNLMKQHRGSDPAAALRGSNALAREYTKIRDDWQIANIHHLRGNTLIYSKADYQAAGIEYGRMLEVARRLDSPDLASKARGALALAYMEQKKFDDGLRCAGELRTVAGKYRLDSWQAYSSLILGDLYRQLGQLDQSLGEYTTALRLAYRRQDEGVLIDTLENLGLTLDRLGRLEDARGAYREALQQQENFLQRQSAQSTSAIIARRLNLIHKEGVLSLRMSDLAAAEAFFQESLKSAPEGMHELKARNRLGLAQVYLSRKQIREAESMLAGIDASGQYPEINWQASYLSGELLRAAGDHAGALSSLGQSIKVLEQMRQNVKLGDLRQSFLTDRFAPYRAIVSVLWQSAGDPGQALEFVDRAKSMTLKEQLNLQNAPPGASHSRPGRAAASDSRTMSVLEYFFVKDQLLIFASTQGRVQVAAQRLVAREVEVLVHEYLLSITRGDLPAFTTLSRRLYSELIAPIETALMAGNPETLVILPDGPLHLLPFAGLQDDRGRFLIERAAIAVAPSSSILRHCLELGRGRNSSDPSILLIDGSANLPNARAELAGLEKLYAGTARLMAPEDPHAGGQAAGASEIIHFAGHSAIRQDKPVLMLHTSPVEAYLDSAAISAWKLPKARLVYLAGCSTGIGPVAEGETPWGLVPAFLNAGAPAIIASLLPVDDGSTRILTARFYELLHERTTNAAALQRAQLALLDAARASGNLNPRSWIPYILVGNPQ